jgi:general stress protein 26
MTIENDAGPVWDLIEDQPMAMLVTHVGVGLDARPMAANVRRDEGLIYILANKDEDTDQQVQDNREVLLTFQKDAAHVVVHGKAIAMENPGKVRELWNVFDKAWWDGPDDPRIRLIAITPGRAEYWQSPGKLISYADMILSAVTGKKPDAGHHGSVRL